MSKWSNFEDEGTLKGSLTEIRYDEEEEKENLPRLTVDVREEEKEDIYPSSEDDILAPWTGGPVHPYWGRRGRHPKTKFLNHNHLRQMYGQEPKENPT